MRLVIEGNNKCMWCGSFKLKLTEKDDGDGYDIYDCEECGARSRTNLPNEN